MPGTSAGASARRSCAECPLVSNAANMTRHQKASGHIGYVDAPPTELNLEDYFQRHKNVYRNRGMASGYSCTDCGGPAQEWSQTHGTDGKDPFDYNPRCKKCHAKYDGVTGVPKSEQRVKNITANHWSKGPNADEIRARISATRRKRNDK